MSEEIKPMRKLTEAERVAAVFSSQGHAPRLADHLPESYRSRVAELADQHGIVAKDAPQRFRKLLREIAEQNKATIKGLE